HNPFGGRGARGRRTGGEYKNKAGIGRKPRAACNSGAVLLPFSPCCRHSLGKSWADSDRFGFQLEPIA
ncbi:MAG: hypothetical protein WA230_04005, partial [Xanthobacteraceae bacterium]